MRIKRLFIIATTFILMSVEQLQPIQALDDGAYLIGCSSSYANPLTGQPEDGGTNIALGDSMISSILEDQLLLEQVGGKIYITVGLGLSSQISNVRMKVMDSQGNMSNKSVTVTGSSQANGDTVKHYRIQVDSLSQYISPIMYVDAMGRDVQFFITLNSSAISAGTGIYTSQMVKTQTETKTDSSTNQTQTQSSSNSENKTSQKATENGTTQTESQEENQQTEDQQLEETKTEVVEYTKESLFNDVQGLTYHEVEPKSSLSVIPFIVVGICGIVIGGFIYVKKIKK